jgi:hypothetical protein
MKNLPYDEYELLEIAQRFKKHFKSLAIINDIYPEINKDFIYRFKARFYEAQADIHNHPLDVAADKITLKLKQNLEELITQIRGLFQILHLKIQKAYPHDAKIWDVYGCSALEQAILDYSAFRTWLKGFLQLANENKRELSIANCPAEMLNEIEDLLKQFDEIHDELMEYLERKEMRSKMYKTNFYELYNLMEIVHNAASKCMEKDPESLKYLTFGTVKTESKNTIDKQSQYTE